MGSIGGYIGLERADGDPRPDGTIALDLGRHALEVILRARAPRRLLAPRYTCDVLAPAIARTGVELEFYDLDDHLDPVLPHGLPAKGDALLYTNYFGLKQATVERLAGTVPHLIVDNAQAFYAPVPSGVDGFNSCRKFFGVADGAFLWCDPARDLPFHPADEADRWTHLEVAAKEGTEAGFALYQQHERRLASVPVRGMSPRTARVIAGLDHAHIKSTRQRNRDLLHAALRDRNRSPIDPAAAEVPMVYPYLSDDRGLRERLQALRIYTARYWPGLLSPLAPTDGAHRFAKNVVYLPVDQRYGAKEMERMLDAIIG